METKKNKKANLENKKLLFFEIGIALTLIAVLAAFEWGTTNKSIAIISNSGSNLIDIDGIPITMPEPPLSEKINQPKITDVFIITDEPTEIVEFFNPEFFPDDPVNIRPYLAPPPEEPNAPDEFDVFIVDEKPQFMGGDENGFTKWVFKQLVYPESPKQNGIQGRVIVQFVVNTNGKVTNIRILRGVDPSLDKEAVRVISMSPGWTPGKHRGKPVSVKYQFPVIFQLK